MLLHLHCELEVAFALPAVVSFAGMRVHSRPAIGVLLWIALLAPQPLPAQECLLIATSGLDAITVFDPGRQRVAARIPVREEPLNVAVSLDGRTAYAANAGDDSISVIDLEQGTSIDHIPVGLYPIDLAVHPDGELLYVSERNSDRVAVVDLGAGQVIGNIAVGSGPSDIVIRGDGRRAYVANFRANTVGVLDLEAGRMVKAIPVGEQPFALVLSPDESRLYVTNTISATLSVIDAGNESVLTTIPLGGFPIDVAVHPDSGAIYVTRGAPEGDVVVIDPATNTVHSTIQVETNAELGGIAVSGDGATVYVVEFLFGNVFFIDSRQERVVGFEPIGGAGSNPQTVDVAVIPSGCPTPPIPRLTADLGAGDDEIQVDRPDALPISGTLRIEAELVTYRSIFLSTLREVTRGVRETAPAAHTTGTSVYLVGVPPDANCDGAIGAADLTDVIRQLPSGDPGPCGGDVDRDELVTSADLKTAITTLYPR